MTFDGTEIIDQNGELNGGNIAESDLWWLLERNGYEDLLQAEYSARG